MNGIKALFDLPTPPRPTPRQALFAWSAMFVLNTLGLWRGSGNAGVFHGAVSIVLLGLFWRRDLLARGLQLLSKAAMLIIHGAALLGLLLIFFGVVWPLGWILRRRGDSPLLWKKDPNALTYRQKSEPLAAEHFHRPF